MIQRIQTVYMLAAVVAILMMLLFELVSYMTPVATFSWTAAGLTSLTPEVPCDEMGWAVLVLLLLMLLLPLADIFLYRKRILQSRILVFTAVLDVLFYGLFYWQHGLNVDHIAALTHAEVTPGFHWLVLAMPLVSLVACVMAWRGVMADIVLLRSLDRLR